MAADLMQFTLPAESHGVSSEGVWLVSFMSFIVYTMMPLYAWHVSLFGICLAIIQVGVSFVTTKHYLDTYWYQVCNRVNMYFFSKMYLANLLLLMHFYHINFQNKFENVLK